MKKMEASIETGVWDQLHAALWVAPIILAV